MSLFTRQLQERVLFLDGAMGTSIHNIEDLDLERDYLGRENCTEVLLLTRPEVIQGIHESFLAAGSDAVETDSFNAQLHTMEDQDLVDRVYELNVLAAQTARKACDKYTTEDRPQASSSARWGRAPSSITLGQDRLGRRCSRRTTSRCVACSTAGPTPCCIETAQDILQVKCAV